MGSASAGTVLYCVGAMWPKSMDLSLRLAFSAASLSKRPLYTCRLLMQPQIGKTHVLYEHRSRLTSVFTKATSWCLIICRRRSASIHWISCGNCNRATFYAKSYLISSLIKNGDIFHTRRKSVYSRLAATVFWQAILKLAVAFALIKLLSYSYRCYHYEGSTSLTAGQCGLS